ncbi:MAG: fumarylacetoacetate hydrolase family protein [Polyangiaceae bacterium]|nr:fumarylacetoacetate hydrolase family protein [Polyangiaceae bacterium]MCW5789188.1 fumarylacetoacetate hydrolase family protein [Polyangiaceae bacterium]
MSRFVRALRKAGGLSTSGAPVASPDSSGGLSNAGAGGHGAAVQGLLDEGGLTLLSAPPWEGGVPTGERLAASELGPLLPPTVPSKIIGVAKNYREHAKEMAGEVPAEPVLFFKPPSSLLAPGGSVSLPEGVERTDFEAELGVIIGRRVRSASLQEAARAVCGYTVVCDITARDYQKRDRLWTRAKGFDGFCPVGPWVVLAGAPDASDEARVIPGAEELGIELRQNGELRQAGNTRDMVFSVPTIIAFASTFMTLEPGDLIATGTPHGVGPLASGDAIAIAIERVGELSFSVA